MRAMFLGLILLLASMPARADVVRLTTGQRVDGRFKEASAVNVVVEVGGREIAFPRDNVQAIYFGATPATPTSGSVARETLQALNAVQAVARWGVRWRDHASRVLDAREQVDRFLQEPEESDADLTRAIVLAMEYYALASSAWTAKAVDRNYLAVGKHPALKECARIQRVISRTPPPFAIPAHIQAMQESLAARYGQGYVAGVRVAYLGIPTLWACAAEKIAEAERLMMVK